MLCSFANNKNGALPSAPFVLFIRVLMLSAPDNFLFEDFHLPCLRQVHRLDDHQLEPLVGNRIPFQVEQEVMPFHIAAVGEINPEVKLDAELRLRIGCVQKLPR
jgi:hypothetical protein